MVRPFASMAMIAFFIALTSHASVFALPDAAVTGIELEGRDLRAGDRLHMRVRVSNQGSSPLPPVPIVLAVDDEQYAEWRLPAALSPGASAAWELTWTAVRGSHVVLAAVDPLNDVVESNEANNSGFISLGVGMEPEPSPWPAALAGFAAFLVAAIAAFGFQHLRKGPKRRQYAGRESRGRSQSARSER